jgi:SAM-dependent methyltransferase
LSIIRHLESGRPARVGQSILERRYRIVRNIFGERLKDSVLLDIGCGNGAQTVFFKDNVKRLIGLDVFSAYEAETSVERNCFEFVRGNALNLPFKTDSIDVVTAFEVLEHLPDDRQAVQEIARVLKPGGVFFFSVPNKWWLFESHGASVPGLSWIPWHRVPFFGWLPRPIHERLAKARTYTLGRARRLIDEFGFKPIADGFITAPLDVLGDSALKWLLKKLVFRRDTTRNPFLAVNLFVASQKSNSTCSVNSK